MDTAWGWRHGIGNGTWHGDGNMGWGMAHGMTMGTWDGGWHMAQRPCRTQQLDAMRPSAHSHRVALRGAPPTPPWGERKPWAHTERRGRLKRAVKYSPVSDLCLITASDRPRSALICAAHRVFQIHIMQIKKKKRNRKEKINRRER